MKYPKILSITLVNGIGFLIFGAILAGCQKTAIHKKGFLTALVKQTSRGPASTVAKFEEHQDPKQIYVYCHINDINPKSCYNRHLGESLTQFFKDKKVPKTQLDTLAAKHKFETVKTDAHKAIDQVFMAITPTINKTVEKRVKFCEANSNLHLDRCLKQYLKKETFEVLNSYQASNKNMNGHEYLFLKDKIQKKLERKLASAQQEIEGKQKKKAQQSFKSYIEDKKQVLLKDHQWLKNSNSLISAKNACVAQVLSNKSLPNHLDVNQAKQIVVEDVCLDVLSNKEIQEKVNSQSYVAFESKLKDFESGIERLAKSWRQSCDGKSYLKFLSCMKELRKTKTEQYFQAWSTLDGNEQFVHQKKIFIMRSHNSGKGIDRAIASEKKF
ncbi:MAG: hypothetical protein KC478_11910 [Bacteriovoracaceae bacterium]|nr:hypothetical protein [Bacteriovoracaceae bacterium]